MEVKDSLRGGGAWIKRRVGEHRRERHPVDPTRLPHRCVFMVSTTLEGKTLHLHTCVTGKSTRSGVGAGTLQLSY